MIWVVFMYLFIFNLPWIEGRIEGIKMIKSARSFSLKRIVCKWMSLLIFYRENIFR